MLICRSSNAAVLLGTATALWAIPTLATGQVTLLQQGFEGSINGTPFELIDPGFTAEVNPFSPSTAVVTDEVSASGLNSLVLDREPNAGGDDEFFYSLRPDLDDPITRNTAGVLSVEYAFRFEDAANGPLLGTTVTDESTSSGQNFTAAGLFVDSVTGEVLFFDPTQVAVGDGFSLLGEINPDIFYTFTIDVDIDAGTVNYGVSGGDLTLELAAEAIGFLQPGFESADALLFVARFVDDANGEVGRAFFDDVLVTIPEPATASLLAGAFGVLALRRRPRS